MLLEQIPVLRQEDVVEDRGSLQAGPSLSLGDEITDVAAAALLPGSEQAAQLGQLLPDLTTPTWAIPVCVTLRVTLQRVPVCPPSETGKPPQRLSWPSACVLGS
jgi:hypothetical protein